MDKKLFQSIMEKVSKFRGLTKDLLNDLEILYPEQSFDTLYSIVFIEYQKRMKINHIKTYSTLQKYWNHYMRAYENNQDAGIILRMSVEYDICPCLIGKIILQKYLNDHKDEVGDTKYTLNDYMRNSRLIPDMDLAYEIFLCATYDNLYSPLSTTMRQSLGQQYEIKLYNEAKDLGFVFKCEDELRKDGYDKTPDIKLEIPVAIDGFVINWIESKALFGTPYIHREYLNNQYLCYWNRFGPGLVIYWFGYCQDIFVPNEKRFIINDHLSKNVTYINDLFKNQ